MSAAMLLAIAMLCQVSPSTGKSIFSEHSKDVANFQLQCQQDYIRCVNLDSRSEAQLARCVLQKKPNK